MKSSLLSLLICQRCGARFNTVNHKLDGLELIEGELVCQGCASRVPIRAGVPRFLPRIQSADQKATADAFGYEWTHYSRLTDADQKEFLAWIAPLKPDDFRNQIVLDAGCGKGRHSFLSARFGADTVVGVDLSDSVEAAFQNTRALPNALLLLPFGSDSVWRA